MADEKGLPASDFASRLISSEFDRMHEQSQRYDNVVFEHMNEQARRAQNIADAAEHSLNAATIAVESLIEEIRAFESQLGFNEEIAIFVIGGPAGQVFFPRDLRALNPDKVLYGGLDQDGRPFSVVQHVSQLNFSMSAKSVAPSEKPRRIGFHIPEE